MVVYIIANALVWCAAASAAEIEYDPPRRSGGSARKMLETEESAGPVRDDVVRAMNYNWGVTPDPLGVTGKGTDTPFGGALTGIQPTDSNRDRAGGRFRRQP